MSSRSSWLLMGRVALRASCRGLACCAAVLCKAPVMTLNVGLIGALSEIEEDI
jgi:hypothetical protein